MWRCSCDSRPKQKPPWNPRRLSVTSGMALQNQVGPLANGHNSPRPDLSDKSVGGTKRIGPFPAGLFNVGDNDTTTLRDHAETLP